METCSGSPGRPVGCRRSPENLGPPDRARRTHVCCICSHAFLKVGPVPGCAACHPHTAGARRRDSAVERTSQLPMAGNWNSRQRPGGNSGTWASKSIRRSPPSIWRTRFAPGVDGAKTGARVTFLACNRLHRGNHICAPSWQGVAAGPLQSRGGTVARLAKSRVLPLRGDAGNFVCQTASAARRKVRSAGGRPSRRSPDRRVHIARGHRFRSSRCDNGRAIGRSGAAGVLAVMWRICHHRGQAPTGANMGFRPDLRPESRTAGPPHDLWRRRACASPASRGRALPAPSVPWDGDPARFGLAAAFTGAYIRRAPARRSPPKPLPASLPGPVTATEHHRGATPGFPGPVVVTRGHGGKISTLVRTGARRPGQGLPPNVARENREAPRCGTCGRPGGHRAAVNSFDRAAQRRADPRQWPGGCCKVPAPKQKMTVPDVMIAVGGAPHRFRRRQRGDHYPADRRRRQALFGPLGDLFAGATSRRTRRDAAGETSPSFPELFLKPRVPRSRCAIAAAWRTRRDPGLKGSPISECMS